jgi:Ras-related protein Rab-11A
MGEELFKVVIIGDSGVGKSNIMTRYAQNEFSNDTPSTIGVEFMTKPLKIDGRDIKVQIWDTAGQERFRAISRSVYHGAKGAMIVYDITNQASFDNVGMWLQELRAHVHPTTTLFLIGNKSDLDHMRAVKKEVADRFARENNMAFMETSALEKINIDRAFEMLVKKMHEAATAASGGDVSGKPKPKAAAPSGGKGSVDLTKPVQKSKPAGKKSCNC